MRRPASISVVLLTAIIALFVHAGVVAAKAGTHPARTMLAIFRVGGVQPHPAFVDEQGFPLEAKGYGTDGQQYLYVAHDPLLRHADATPAPIWKFVDAPRYRYGRILFPALAAATCADTSRCIPYAMIGWNLVFAGAIGALAAWLVHARGGHWLWGVFLACTGALVCATDLATTELAAQAFGLLGVVLVATGRTRAAVVAWAFAVLSRETYALLPAGFAAAAILERRWKEAALFSISVVPALVWAAFVAHALPRDVQGGTVLLVPPFYGIGAHVVDFVRRPVVTGHTLITVVVGVPFLLMIARHIASLRTDRSGLALATAFFGALAVCAGPPVWLSAGGFARAVDFLYPGVVLCALSRGDRIARLLALATIPHALDIVADHFVT